MSLTQSATNPSAQPPSGEPTSSIPDNYDANGIQQVSDDVFGFDEPASEAPETPTVTTIHETDEEFEATQETTEEPTDETVQEPNQDPENPQQPTAQEPAQPQTELKMYANKFKSVQDLKNSFIELGGDPAKYGDNVQQLEEAYAIRQREYSRVRAEIAHPPAQPAAPQKTVQELMQEQFGSVDPSKFQTPQEMWQAMMNGFGNVLNQVQAQQPQPQQGYSPQEVARHVKTVEAISELERLAPIIKTNKMVRDNFAMHIRVLRDEGRMPTTPDGQQDLKAAYKDFVQGYSALLSESQKSFTDTANAKQLSTATNQDTAQKNPAAAPKVSASDALVNEILDYKKEYDRKYN